MMLSHRGLVLFLLIILPGLLWAQQVVFEGLEFADQPLKDILAVLGEVGDRRILPDSTVTGRGNYVCGKGDFNQALNHFLEAFHLYSRTEGEHIYVSRIRWKVQEGLVSLEGRDVLLKDYIETLSRAVGKTILFDPLPQETLSVHLKEVSPEKALQVLLLRFPQYQLEVVPEYFYIHLKETLQEGSHDSSDEDQSLSRTGDLYTLKVKHWDLRSLLQRLFQLQGVEGAFLFSPNPQLKDIFFQDKSFSQILRLILLHGGMDVYQEGDVYYVHNLDQKEWMKQFRNTISVELKFIEAADLPKLFPPGLAFSGVYRIDENRGRIILSGSGEELKPILDFIGMVDVPWEGKSLVRYDLDHLTPKDMIELLPEGLLSQRPTALEGRGSLFFLLSPDKKIEVDSYIALLDCPEPVFFLDLKYLKGEDFLKTLPPFVSKEDFFLTPDPGSLYFAGTQGEFHQLKESLVLLDRPQPQIRYDILVMQYNEGESFDLSLEGALAPQSNDSETMVKGMIGELLNLGLDVIGAFGYQYALSLNANISRKQSKILTDTRLTALSGEKISFRNTQTYNYIAKEIDEDTQELKDTGVTQQIQAGLIIDLEGWVSKENMITLKVKSTVSQQENGDASELPGTSEKVVSTKVRTSSGEPLVISGLRHTSVNREKQPVFLLGYLPLVGRLFQNPKESVSQSEFVIYVVPHLIPDGEQQRDSQSRIDRVWKAQKDKML